MKTYISYYFLIVFLSCKNTDENPTKDRYSTNNTHTTNNTENEYLTLIKHYDLNPEDKIENKQFIDYMNNIHGGKIPFYDEKIYSLPLLPRKGGFKDFKETIIKEFKILNQKELKTFEDLYKILNSIHSLHKKKDSYLDLDINIKTKSQHCLFSNKILEFLKGVEKNKLKQELIVLDPDQENLSTSNDFYKIIEKARMYRIYKRENKDEIILRFFIRLDDKSEKEYNNTKLEKLKLINIRNSSIRLQSKEIQLNEYSKNSSEKLVNMYDEFSKKIEKNYPFLEYILKKIKEKDKNFEIIKDLLKEYYAMTSDFNLSSFPKYFGYSLILKEKGKKCIIRIFYYPLSLNDGNACYFTDAENIKKDNDELSFIKRAESEEKKYIEFELN